MDIYSHTTDDVLYEEIIEDEDIRDYYGAEVIVTLLNHPQRKAKKAPVDWYSFVIPSILL